MPARYDDRWQRFAPSVPIPVEDGLATSRQRGAMAEHWWSKRFTEVLESFGLGGRMQRGRRYARTGQVVTLEVEPGMVAAQVQGSRRTPYLVSVRCVEVTDRQWAKIEDEFRSRVGLIASLLAGEVPADLEHAFDAAGVALFPGTWADLRARCNCPDDASPCKHLAAVLYLFADRLDGDPWLLLEWRGRSRQELLDLLREGESGAEPVAPWWPFAPGPIPDAVLVPTATDAAGAVGGLGRRPGSVLDRLEPTDIEVLGSPLPELLTPAYEALEETVSDDTVSE